MLESKSRKSYLGWGTGSALRISAIASIVAAAFLRFRSSHASEGRLPAVVIAEYMFIMFAAIALVSLYAGFAERSSRRKFFEFPGLIWPAAALLFCGVYKLGMHQYGGWDEDLLVHAGTYYAQDLKPYIDFPCTMPPLFMACTRFAVELLGLRWSSFTLISATFSTFTSLWIFALLRRCSMPRQWALVVTIAVEMSTMLAIPFWWYNNSSSIVVVLLFLSVLACLQQQESLLPWISLSLSLAMVLTSKPNIAPACLMPLALLVTKDKAQWVKALSACVGALGLAALICFAAQMPPPVVLHSYVEVAKLRGEPFLLLREMGWPEKQFQILFIFATAYCFAVPLAICLKRNARHWPVLAVCTIAALTSLGMASTNSEMKTSDLTPLLVAAAILYIRPWDEPQANPGGRAVLVGLLSVFIAMSGLDSVIHLRIHNIGPRMYYEPLPTQTIQSGFFSGLEAGPRLQRVLSQTGKALSLIPAQRVFFGPRMEFGYAAFGKPVTPGMPLVWDAGNLFSPQRLPQFLLNFQQRDPDLLIFLRGDYTGMGLVGSYIRITETYQRVDSFSELDVYVRRKDVPIASIRVPAPDLTSSK
jgi:hypothetical protein